MLVKLCFLIKFYVCALAIFCVTFLISFASLYTVQFAANKPTRTEYDYIIVGAGTAGTTIINGLGDDLNILLIDAGGIPSTFMDVPIITPLIHGTHFDWEYETMTQRDSCKSLNRRRSKWSAGKGYGGSNILNNMISHWGHKEDFRGWFSCSESYDYDKDILPHFKDLENSTTLPATKTITKFGQAIYRTLNTLGISFSVPKLYQKDGWRWTMAHEAYENLKSNHEIFAGALVTKILLESNDLSSPISAKGVEIIKSGRIRQIKAKKGVILTAGSIGTPKILMQSGIGPCDYLSTLGIGCHINLPVGDNLQDHVTTGLDLITLNTSLGITLPDLISFKHVKDFFWYGHGPLTLGGCEVLGFLEKNNEQSPPELGFMVMPVGITADLGISLRHVINLNEKWWDKYFQYLVAEGRQTVSILPILLHPRSRGVVRIQSDDPLEPPIIDPRYFENRQDVVVMIRGLQLVDQLLQSSTKLQELGAKIYERPYPGCENYRFKSDGYWECYVRHLTLTAYHPVGTCKMGNQTDPETVVNRDYRVKGTNNLFIVDASILPHLPSGSPNAVVAMLAQKFVKELLKSNQEHVEMQRGGHLRDEL